MADENLVTTGQLRSTAERVANAMNDMVDDTEFDAATTQLRTEHQNISNKIDEVLAALAYPSAEGASF